MPNETTEERLRERLRELRGRAGLSQEKVAKRLKISLRQYNRWETGASAFPVEHVDRLARALRVQPEELLAVNHDETDARLQAMSREIDELQEIVDQLQRRLGGVSR